MQCNVMQCNVMYICLHIDSLTQFEMEDHLASDFVSVQKTKIKANCKSQRPHHTPGNHLQLASLQGR